MGCLGRGSSGVKIKDADIELKLNLYLLLPLLSSVTLDKFTSLHGSLFPYLKSENNDSYLGLNESVYDKWSV